MAAPSSKRHLTICTVGHVDTTFTDVLALAYASITGDTHDEIDAVPEIFVPIITTNAVVIDFPKHSDYVKNMIITGATPIDGIILVVSSDFNHMTLETRERILLAKLVGVPNIVVFFDKNDLVVDNELVNSVYLEVRDLLSNSGYGFLGNFIPIIAGSSLKAVEVLTTNPRIKEGDNEWVDKIYKLIKVVDGFTPIPERQLELPFSLEIQDVDTNTERLTAATCRMERGVVKRGVPVDIVGSATAYISGIIINGKNVEEATPGENVGIMLGCDKRDSVQRGMVLAELDTFTFVTEFMAIVYVLKEDEGGTHTPITEGYSCQFKVRSRDITGKVITIMNDYDEEVSSNMVMPGDHVKMAAKLEQPIACEAGMKFAIREGEKNIGAGVVLSVIESIID